MRVKPMYLAASIALSTTLLLGGCKSSAPAPAPAATPAPTQALNPDGTPATPTSSSAAPATPAVSPATSVPAVPPPPPPTPVAAAAPLPPPPPPAPVRLTAPAGTAVTVTVTEQLSASKNSVGDGFTGVLAAPVRTAGGGTVFPRGARVVGTVVAAKGRGRFKGSGALGIAVTQISGTSVSTNSYEKDQAGKGKRSAGFIGGGAGGGALIGGLAGGGKGALLGGLLGAGAGTAGAAFTGNKDVVIPSESTVTFHLTAPVTVTARSRAAAADAAPTE
ncbi:hypothetical protein [Tunturibacter empetritectus]|uniref:Uncharacterized protein n=1 Tax=Tunturiibacter lichenicola TaxID=2051959 RepID=A0A7W8JCB5_9BACT|nr:hypothetical protein [Edaphobacter lichenicola]MBB5345312.1 hypothetical protein [Edaphobacter lichenicola]